MKSVICQQGSITRKHRQTIRHRKETRYRRKKTLALKECKLFVTPNTLIVYANVHIIPS